MNKRVVVAVLGIVSFLVGLVSYYLASRTAGSMGMAGVGFALQGLFLTVGGLIILVLALVKRNLFKVVLIVLILVPHVVWIYGPVRSVSTSKETYSVGETVEIYYSIFYVNVLPARIFAPGVFLIYYDTKPNSTEDFFKKYDAVWWERKGGDYSLVVFFTNTRIKFVWNQTCEISPSEPRYQALPGHYCVSIRGLESFFTIQ